MSYIEFRAKRIAAYRKGEYKFSAPPVCTALWDEEAWMNFVKFDNPDLNGFVEYNAAEHHKACELLRKL